MPVCRFDLHGRDLRHGDHGGKEAHERADVDIDHAGSTAVSQTISTCTARISLVPAFRSGILRGRVATHSKIDSHVAIKVVVKPKIE